MAGDGRGMGGRPAPLPKEFDIADFDRAAVNDLKKRVAVTLEEAGHHTIIPAALAELSARHMETSRTHAPPFDV